MKRVPVLLCLTPFLLSAQKPITLSLPEAREFLDKAEIRLLELSNESNRASWVQSNFITDDTEALSALASGRAIAAGVELAKGSDKFEMLSMPEDMRRKLKLLKVGLTLAAPDNPKERDEMTRLASKLEGEYGKGKYCPSGATAKDACFDINRITKIMAESRDPKQLLDVWNGWHTISRPMKRDYARLVALANKGARDLGFANTGDMWRSKYDMEPDAFERELDRLWLQVRPLYLSLHAYVRSKLREKYGDAVVPANGPIPAHLLGNIWAQDWTNIYPLAAPKDSDPGFDLTAILKQRGADPIQMVKYGEAFFMSLGFAPLPPTFWERSLFVKPRDRDVVCHASAWDVDNVNDLRIKMCIEITGEDFRTIHHELGHNFYQRAYNTQPFLFRDSANDGFHEAVGDTIALSVTPAYLVKLGFLKTEPDPSKDIGLLLQKALEKVAFLPFGLMIDQWRWKVFSGEVTPDNYNAAWWELRRKYQGVAPPETRSENDFDPGAKYHVAANVPYMRYFLADILQFQFHRALSQVAGCREPLNRCSIYDSKPAGTRLNTMLSMGQSRPWPDALAAISGQKKMDASAIVDYFAPLQKWLDEQNKGKPVGW
jgi:peptidyl-dipeptidase A